MSSPAAASRPSRAIRDDAGVRSSDGELECTVVAGALWDRLVAGFDGVCQEQLHAFAASRWPGMDIEPLLFRQHGRVVGGCLVLIRKFPAGLGGFAVVKWGPVLAERNGSGAEEIHSGMVSELVDRYARSKGLFVTILPRAVPASPNPASTILAENGFFPGSSLPYPNRYFVRIDLKDTEQTASFGQKWRYHLKKSRQNTLTFSRREPADLEIFNNLYSAMTERKRFPDYSAFSTLNELFACEDPRLRPELFFVHCGGVPVAGAIVFTAGDTAVYLYGATANDALPLRAGYFMQAEIIRWLRENTGAGWYDLGGTDGYDGLHRFKSGMAGKAGAIEPVPAVMHFAPNTWSKLIGLGVYGARDFKSNLTRRINSLRAGR
ncbi:MAG: aminoacyltransferase [Alphaproteobacteria bacterium]|nr:aminoacyltransferase [Alphaproteobacteria bacterium]